MGSLAAMRRQYYGVTFPSAAMASSTFHFKHLNLAPFLKSPVSTKLRIYIVIWHCGHQPTCHLQNTPKIGLGMLRNMDFKFDFLRSQHATAGDRLR